jgi:integrase
VVYRVAAKRVRRPSGTEVEPAASRAHAQAKSGSSATTLLPQVLEGFCEHLRVKSTHRSLRGTLSRLRNFFGPITPSLYIQPPGAKDGSRRRKPVPDRYAGRHVLAQNLEDITPAVVEQFIEERLKSGDWKAPKTANSLRQVLHQFFEYAIKHHGFQSRDHRYPNPAKSVDRIPEAAPKIRFLTLDQIDDQLEAVKKDQVLHATVAIFVYAGLRRSEACWLTREDVDLEKRIIRVEAKVSGFEEWQPKTRRNRAVPISERLAAILRDYDPPGRSRWYLPSPRGKRWDPDNLSKRLRRVNREAGLPWTFLDFRHTFGSQLAQKGLSLYKISALMGNSPEICRRHYAAIVPEAMHEEVEFGESATHDSHMPKTDALLREVIERLEALGMARPVLPRHGRFPRKRSTVRLSRTT